MSRLALDGQTRGSTFEIVATGEIDVDNADQLLELGQLGLAQQRIARLSVDLSAVEFMDSTGLGVLVTLLNQSRASGQALELRKPHALVLKILHITGLDSVFTVIPAGPAEVVPSPAGPS